MGKRVQVEKPQSPPLRSDMLYTPNGAQAKVQSGDDDIPFQFSCDLCAIQFPRRHCRPHPLYLSTNQEPFLVQTGAIAQKFRVYTPFRDAHICCFRDLLQPSSTPSGGDCAFQSTISSHSHHHHQHLDTIRGQTSPGRLHNSIVPMNNHLMVSNRQMCCFQ